MVFLEEETTRTKVMDLVIEGLLQMIKCWEELHWRIWPNSVTPQEVVLAVRHFLSELSRCIFKQQC